MHADFRHVFTCYNWSRTLTLVAIFVLFFIHLWFITIRTVQCRRKSHSQAYAIISKSSNADSMDVRICLL